MRIDHWMSYQGGLPPSPERGGSVQRGVSVQQVSENITFPYGP